MQQIQLIVLQLASTYEKLYILQLSLAGTLTASQDLADCFGGFSMNGNRSYEGGT